LKIIRLELTHVRPRWLFLKVHTDEGIAGYGEPILEGKARSVEMAVRELEPYIIGKDVERIVHSWQAMYRWSFYRGGPIILSAISGIEQAMWDILGKSLNKPVYQLLGGAVRDKVKVYAGVGGRDAGEYAENALKRRDEGFRAIKMCPSGIFNIIDTPEAVKKAAAEVKAVREAVGDGFDVAVDCHGKLSPSMAVLLAKSVEPYQPLFLEEPCLPENVDVLARVARSTTIPIATGERLFTRWGFREVIEKQAAAVLQPDVSHAGGIFECRMIAAMAEVYYSAIAPHCPLGPIAMASCIQLDACTPNFLIQEMGCLGEGYLKEPFKVEDGYIEIPKKPGLGIELDDEAIKAKIYPGDWRHEGETHEDGSVADF
jgi:galactonate dehydratase